MFKEMPVRDKITNGRKSGGYDTWVIGKYPIEDHSVYSKVKLGRYDSITWENGIVEIESLIRKENKNE